MSAERILLVDDDPSNRLTFAALLEDEGYVVDCAASVAEGFAAVEGNERYALLILDKHLPDGDGTELASRLRSRHPELRIALLTGDPDHDSPVADLVLSKGESSVALLQRIARLLGPSTI